jgi:hypothetical protein
MLLYAIPYAFFNVLGAVNILIISITKANTWIITMDKDKTHLYVPPKYQFDIVERK